MPEIRQLFLPLMLISLVSAMENIPDDVIPAARVLGASWLQVFWRVILPLTLCADVISTRYYWGRWSMPLAMANSMLNLAARPVSGWWFRRMVAK